MSLKLFKPSTCVVLVLLILVDNVHAQDSIQILKSNFHELSKRFLFPESYPEFNMNVTEQQRKLFYKDYGILAPRVDANGTLESYLKEINNIQPKSNLKSTEIDYWWNFLGPVGIPVTPGNGASGATGEGWVNALYVAPSDLNTVFVGGRHGGLWRSTNLGNSWTPLTDSYSQINGIISFAIDPYDPGHILLCSGKSFIGRAYNVSNGLFISTNEGLSWSFNPIEITSENWYPTVDDRREFRVIKFHPTIENYVYILTHDRILRSTDGGDTWALLLDSTFATNIRGFTDLEFDTQNSNTLYVSSNYIFKSNNLGTSWSDITNAVTGTAYISNRIEMDVESHSPGYVWFLIWETNSQRICLYNGTSGTYISSDLNMNLNLSGMMVEFDVSPISSDIIYYSGYSLWRYITSTSTKQSLSRTSTGPSDTSWVHTDIRSMSVVEHNGLNRIYLGHDGGISWCEDNGLSQLQYWHNISDDGSNGLQLTEFYGVGSSELNPDNLMGGCQDVAAFYYDGSDWYHSNDGDCGETKFSNLDEDLVFQLVPCCYSATGLYYSENGGKDVTRIFSHGQTDVFRPLTLKNLSDTILVGWDDIIVVPDYTNSSSKYSLGLPGSNLITAIEVSKYSEAILYAARSKAFFYWEGVDPQDYANSVFRSLDNGDNWDDISANFHGLYGGWVSDFETNPFNPNEVWVTLVLSEANANPQVSKKIYRSTNSGDSWTAFVEGFPEYIPVSKIEFDREEYVLYIASDIGVYYRRLDENSWYPYHSYNLPYKIVTDLEINQSSQKVRIGTLGRGIWETSTMTTYNPSEILYISGAIGWSSNKVNYNDIEIAGSLTLYNDAILTMHPQSSIRIKSGGELNIVDGAIINHANIIVESGGSLVLEDESRLILYENDEVNIELGAQCSIDSGDIIIKD